MNDVNFDFLNVNEISLTYGNFEISVFHLKTENKIIFKLKIHMNLFQNKSIISIMKLMRLFVRNELKSFFSIEAVLHYYHFFKIRGTWRKNANYEMFMGKDQKYCKVHETSLIMLIRVYKGFQIKMFFSNTFFLCIQ